MEERGEKDDLKDELLPEEESHYSLESFDMLRVIGTGTFGRVYFATMHG